MEELPNKPYDKGSKRLLAISAQALLDWLAPGARFTGQFAEGFQSREIQADAMIETYINSEREMAHFEFQSRADPNMAQRMLEYSALAYARYQCPIRSYVLYLRKNEEPPQSPLLRKYSTGEQYLWFHYEEVQVWKTPHREVLDQDKQGLFPLVPLMDGGARREVIEEMIARLQPAHDIISKELITLTSLFSSLAFSTPEDLEWSRRRFARLKDIFEGTPMHEYYMELTREENAQRMREELCKKHRNTLLTIVQARFPTLVDVAHTQAEQINNADVLEEMIGKVGSARTVKEARHALLTWDQTEQND